MAIPVNVPGQSVYRIDYDTTILTGYVTFNVIVHTLSPEKEEEKKIAEEKILNSNKITRVFLED